MLATDADACAHSLAPHTRIGADTRACRRGNHGSPLARVRSARSGKLHVYRGCNSVWTFFVKNALIKESGSVQELGREPREMVAELLKVVLVDGTGRLPPARRG